MGPGPSKPRLSLWGGSAVRIVKNAICLWHDPEAGEVAPRSIFHLFVSWRIIGGQKRRPAPPFDHKASCGRSAAKGDH